MTDHEIATKVVFEDKDKDKDEDEDEDEDKDEDEDEEVRIWNQVVHGGEDIPKQAHKHDYFLLNVSGEGSRSSFTMEQKGPLEKRSRFIQRPVLQTL